VTANPAARRPSLGRRQPWQMHQPRSHGDNVFRAAAQLSLRTLQNMLGRSFQNVTSVPLESLVRQALPRVPGMTVRLG